MKFETWLKVVYYTAKEVEYIKEIDMWWFEESEKVVGFFKSKEELAQFKKQNREEDGQEVIVEEIEEIVVLDGVVDYMYNENYDWEIIEPFIIKHKQL